MANPPKSGDQALLQAYDDDEESFRVVVEGSVAPSAGALTDRSGTVTAGGTSQEIMAANADRKYLFVENVSSGDLWLAFGGDAVATQPSILIPPRMAFVMESGFIDNRSVEVLGATTGQAFTAKEA